MTKTQNRAFETSYNQLLFSIKKRFGTNANKDTHYSNTHHSSPNEKFLDLIPDTEIITEIEDSEDSNLGFFPKTENIDTKFENFDTKFENFGYFDQKDSKRLDFAGFTGEIAVGGTYDDGLRVIKTDRGFGSGKLKGGKVKGGKKKNRLSGGDNVMEKTVGSDFSGSGEGMVV
jgi:hypothetical protein